MSTGVPPSLQNIEKFNIINFNWFAIIVSIFGMVGYSGISLILGPFFTFNDMGTLFGPLQIFNREDVLPFSLAGFTLFTIFLIYNINKISKKNQRKIIALVLLLVITYSTLSIGRLQYYFAMGKSISFYITMPRYHYVGPLFVSAILCIFISQMKTKRLLKKHKIYTLLYTWLAILIVPCWRVAPMINRNHGFEEKKEYSKVITEIADKLQQHPKNSDVYLANKKLDSISSKGGRFPNQAALFIMAFPENRVNERNIYFVESDPNILKIAKKFKDTRISALLVSPDQVPTNY
jgi:hypothetical protein